MACCYDVEGERRGRAGWWACCAQEEDTGAEVKPIPVSTVWSGAVAAPDQVEPEVAVLSSSDALPSGLVGATLRNKQGNAEGHSPEHTEETQPPPHAPEAAQGEAGAPCEAEESPTSPFSYDVELDLSSADLGMKLYVMPASISVSAVKNGAVERYNQSGVPAFKRVRLNDFIQQVNGRSDMRYMVEALKSKDKISVRFFRPLPYLVVLNKQEKSLGCRINAMPGHSVIYVSDVLGGTTAAYNASVPECRQIKAHDCFTAVNDKVGDVDLMLTELQEAKSGPVQLTVIRPP